MSATPMEFGRRPSLNETNGRRRSLGRVLDRFKTVFQRRDSAIRPNSAALGESYNENTLAREQDVVVAKRLSVLSVDDSENIPGSAEAPIVSLGVIDRESSGMAEGKTKQLFERHGLTYQNRRSTNSEPPVKMRRIDRPVRMRVRWTCHACRDTFGSENYCPRCGHRRCFECHREPAKRERAVVDDIQLFEEPVFTQPAEIMQAVEGAEEKEPQWQCTIHVGRPRPSPAEHDPTASRDCHECEATVEAGQERCHKCNHDLCILCHTHTETQLQAAVTAPVVERVYRKPRQRVRYNCEHCNVQFTDQAACTGCGHERCLTCPRFPPRKRKTPHDPLAWEALQAKMARVNEPPLLDEAFHARL